jgi:hypothetical protein
MEHGLSRALKPWTETAGKLTMLGPVAIVGKSPGKRQHKQGNRGLRKMPKSVRYNLKYELRQMHTEQTVIDTRVYLPIEIGRHGRNLSFGQLFE